MWVRQKDVEKGEMGMEGGEEVRWRKEKEVAGRQGKWVEQGDWWKDSL